MKFAQDTHGEADSQPLSLSALGLTGSPDVVNRSLASHFSPEMSYDCLKEDDNSRAGRDRRPASALAYYAISGDSEWLPQGYPARRSSGFRAAEELDIREHRHSKSNLRVVTRSDKNALNAEDTQRFSAVAGRKSGEKMATIGQKKLGSCTLGALEELKFRVLCGQINRDSLLRLRVTYSLAYRPSLTYRGSHQKYSKYFDTLHHEVQELCQQYNLSLESNTRGSHGSFEIDLLWENQGRVYWIHLFSKLASEKWPDIPFLVRKISETLPKEGQPDLKTILELNNEYILKLRNMQTEKLELNKRHIAAMQLEDDLQQAIKEASRMQQNLISDSGRSNDSGFVSDKSARNYNRKPEVSSEASLSVQKQQQAEIDTLKLQLLQAKTQLSQLNETKAWLSSDLQSMRRELQSCTRVLGDILETSDKEPYIVKKESILPKIEQDRRRDMELKRCRQQLREARDGIDALKDEVDQGKRALADSQRRLKAIEQEKEDLRQELERSRSRPQAADDDLWEKLQGTQHRKPQQPQDFDDLCITADSRRSRNGQMQTEDSAMRERLSQLKLEHAQMEKRMQVAVGSLDVLEQENLLLLSLVTSNQEKFLEEYEQDLEGRRRSSQLRRRLETATAGAS